MKGIQKKTFSKRKKRDNYTIRGNTRKKETITSELYRNVIPANIVLKINTKMYASMCCVKLRYEFTRNDSEGKICNFYKNQNDTTLYVK